MRNSGPFFVIRLSFTSRTKNSVCLLPDFSRGPCRCARPETSHSQISHPYSGSSWPFSLLHPLPQSLSHSCSTQHHLTTVIPSTGLKEKISCLNIPPDKKKTRWRGTCLGFIRERDLTLSVWGARSGSNPYFFCIHLSSYNTYQLSITDTRLSTVGW
jgi:hypothetical protein